MNEETIKTIEAVNAGTKISYKQFEKMMLDILSDEIEFQKKNWVFGLEFMRTWEPSEFKVKGEENE